MYYLKNLTKKFESQTVLENFNFTFPQRGFCVLMGRSGSGKSTLLNLLSGIESPDSGSIWFNGKDYGRTLKWEDVSSCTAYITQTVYLPEYLSVMDSMKMVCKEEEHIHEVLQEFDLDQLEQQQVRFCSGGEKQRLVLVRSLLDQKKVILLDEPTASLDLENKLLVFDMLKQISEKALVICASHDPQVLDFCDMVIDFNHLEEFRENGKETADRKDEDIVSTESVNLQNAAGTYRADLSHYIKQWFSSDMRSRISGKIMTVLTGVILILLCLCSTVSEKNESCIQHFYQSNVLKIWCTGDNWKEVYEVLDTSEMVKDYGLLYNLSVNDGAGSGSADPTSQMDYDLMANTLPYDADAFLYSDHILYGTYFTAPDQVLLSYEKALGFGDPERLIGTKLPMELYGGSYELTIAGVFSPFTSAEETFLFLSGVDMETNYEKEIVFLNSEFMKRYIEDESFNLHGQRVFSVFFENFQEMKDFYKIYSDRFPGVRMSYTDVPVALSNIFLYMSLLLLPVFLVFLPVIILFYQQSQKMELYYNRQIFACFDYLGYQTKQVRRCFIRCSLAENGKRFLLCIAVIGPVMLAINYLNLKMQIFPFELFTINPLMILGYFLFSSALNLFVFTAALRSIKADGWYRTVASYEDMI